MGRPALIAFAGRGAASSAVARPVLQSSMATRAKIFTQGESRRASDLLAGG
jgi:hypothetical protein